MGEPPIPTVEMMPADVPDILPFGITWQAVVVALLILFCIGCFFVALRDPDPLRKTQDPGYVSSEDRMQIPLGVGYYRDDDFQFVPLPALTSSRARVDSGSMLAIETTRKIGVHRAPEAPHRISSHRRPAPRWARRIGAGAGLVSICFIGVAVGIALVLLLEG